MSSAQIFTTSLVKHIGTLSAIPLEDEAEVDALVAAFQETLETINLLREIDVTDVEPAHHVSGLENQLRSDTYDPEREFSQAEALQNATRSHDGYFVVPRVIAD